MLLPLLLTWCPLGFSTGHPNLHKGTEPILNFRPVTCATAAKVFLEQCAPIVVDDNYTAESLTNVLFNISNEGKIPKHIAATIKAIGYLIVRKVNKKMSELLTATISDKLSATSQTLFKDIEHACNFLKADIIKQSKLTLKLYEMANASISTLQKLEAVTQSLEMTLASIQPRIQALPLINDHLFSLSESSKTITETTKKLKDIPQISDQLHHPSYADIANNYLRPSTTNNTYNPPPSPMLTTIPTSQKTSTESPTASP